MALLSAKDANSTKRQTTTFWLNKAIFLFSAKNKDLGLIYTRQFPLSTLVTYLIVRNICASRTNADFTQNDAE